MSEKDMINDHTDLIKSFNSHKRTILIFTILSIVVSLLFTAFKTKKYVSSVTFFPSTFNAPDIANQVPRMGYNIEADRLIQIAQSNLLKDSLCKKFNLIEKFNIDTTQDSWKNNLHSKLSGMMHFERTKYMSIVLSFTSSDPDLSADLANHTVKLLARFWERMYKENSKKSLIYNEKAVAEKSKEVLMLLDSIAVVRKSNKNEKILAIKEQLAKKQKLIDSYVSDIKKLKSKSEFYNSEYQLEKLTEKRIENNAIIETENERLESMKGRVDEGSVDYINARASLEGAKKNLAFINNGIESLKSNGNKYDHLQLALRMELNLYQALESQYEMHLIADEMKINSVELEELEARLYFQRQQFNLIKGNFESNYDYYHKPLPNIFISEYAVPNFRKSSPSYLKNALLAGLLGFISSLTFLLVFFRDKSEIN